MTTNHLTTRFTTNLVFFLKDVHQKTNDMLKSENALDLVYIYWYLELALNLMKPYFFTNEGYCVSVLDNMGLTNRYVNMCTRTKLQTIEIPRILDYLTECIQLIKHGPEIHAELVGTRKEA